MKRIIAWGLTLSLCCGLFITAAFAEEGTAGETAETATAEQTTAAGSAENTEQDAAETARETGEAQTGAESGTAGGETPAGEDAAPETPDVPEPDAPGTLSFANLESRVRENNLTVQALNESIASVNAIDFEQMEKNMRDKLNTIAGFAFSSLTMSDDQFDDYLDQISAFTGADINRKVFNSMMDSRESLKKAFDDLIDGKTQRTYDGVVRQLNNAEDQMVMGAETLYVALLEMKNTHADLQRQLASVDRTLQEMELRYSMGQISALTLQQVKSGRASLVSGIATLERNISDYTAQLEQLVGAEITGSLTLGSVPEVTDAQIAAMDAEKDLEAAKEKSYELFDAELTLTEAKETWDDVRKEYSSRNYMRISGEHTWKAAQFTYQSVVQSYELKFHTMFNAVADYRQVLTAREAALALERDNCQASELKYKQGTISRNALLDARDKVATAEKDVETARHNLFTAYRAYCWAVNTGILN